MKEETWDSQIKNSRAKIYPVISTKFLCYFSRTGRFFIKLVIKIGIALFAFGYTTKMFIVREISLKCVARKIFSPEPVWLI